MKTTLRIIAAVAIALALAIATSLIPACGQKPAGPSPDDVTPTDIIDDNLSKPALDDGLAECIDAISSGVEVGTAGSTLKTAAATAKLMDWAASTAMTEENITSAVTAKLDNMSTDDRESFAVQMDAVDNMYKLLLTEGQQDLLSSAGYEGSGYPWNSDDVAEIETVMKAVGLR